jgi:hypothetical protein
LRVKWDLANVVQKKGESLREFIQHFCNKRNIIPEVDYKSIIMFFKKGLILDSQASLKNPRMPEVMMEITNKYALAEEATIDTKEQKKDKELGHLDQPNTSKSHDMKRKADGSMANVEWPCHNKEYWPSLGEF